MYSRPGQHFPPYCQTPTTSPPVPPLLTTPFPLTVLSCMAPSSPSPATLRMRMISIAEKRGKKSLRTDVQHRA